MMPCDLCSVRYNIPEREFPPSADDTTLPPFIVPAIITKKQKQWKKVDELKEKEKEVVEKAFDVYEFQLYAKEQLVAPHRYCPRSLYFQKPLRTALTVNILKINSRSALNVILASHEWPFIKSQGSPLFDLISSLQDKIILARKVKSKKTKKVVSSPDQSSDLEMEIPPTLPVKRAALGTADNQRHAKRQPQQTLAEAESFYACPVSRSYRNNTQDLPDENTLPSEDNQRRSTRLRSKHK